MNLIFAFQRLSVSLLSFQALSVSRISRFLRVNSSLEKNLNQYEKFHLRRSRYMCANCKDMAYLVTEISIIGWHTQIF